MSQVVGFSSLKGGVGKTTCAILMAEHLQAAGKRLLLVDLDPQHSLSTYFAGRGMEWRDGTHVLNFLTSSRRAQLHDFLVEEDGITLLPGSMELSRLVTEPPRGRRRRRLIRKLKSTGEHDQYDYVLIDTAPTLSFLNLLTLPATHYLMLVTTPEVWAVRAINLYLESLQAQIRDVGSQLRDVAVVTNAYDHSRKRDEEVLDALKESLPDYVADVPIPYSKAVHNYVLRHRERSRYLQKVRDAVAEIVASVLGEPL
jgi:chromosome partitioning protein